MSTHIIVLGNPIDGLQFVGPFDTVDDAIAWAAMCKADEWWTAKLEADDRDEPCNKPNYIGVTGQAVDGLEFIGPFDTHEIADDHNDFTMNPFYSIQPLEKP